ncbi:MAG: IS4 family transposase [Planctomycetes bacterium]|nr:IS4 family transposase [Planctomycetota bacterium]
MKPGASKANTKRESEPQPKSKASQKAHAKPKAPPKPKGQGKPNSKPNAAPKFKSEELLAMFQKMFSGELIEGWLEGCAKRFYHRLWPPLVTLWGMVYQRLDSGHTCDDVVSYVRGGDADGLDRRHETPLSKRMKSEKTSAYCRARQRLPLGLWDRALAHTSEVIERQMGQALEWLGHQVGILDGTTIRLRPHEKLVERYGQHSNQHGRTYWVLMRVVGAFSAFGGALRAVADGAMQVSEGELASGLIRVCGAGWVWIGDRNFGIFRVIQAAREAAAWVVVRMTDSRAERVAGRKLRVGEDVRVRWAPTRSDQLNPGLSAEPVEGRLIRVQVGRPGFRTVDLILFTTLLDAAVYTVEELVKLYGVRWHVELNLRHVKTTLKMAELSGKSPEVVQGELRAGLLAYNLIRGVMAEAARRVNRSPLKLSFSRCWRRVRHTLLRWSRLRGQRRMAEELDDLLARLGECTLPKREVFRIEPRVVRPRPNVYPVLRGSRDEARQKLLQQLRAVA